MSIDRKTLLRRRELAVRVLANPDATDEAKSLAKTVRDKGDAIMGMQDAMARKAARGERRT